MNTPWKLRARWFLLCMAAYVLVLFGIHALNHNVTGFLLAFCFTVACLFACLFALFKPHRL